MGKDRRKVRGGPETCGIGDTSVGARKSKDCKDTGVNIEEVRDESDEGNPLMAGQDATAYRAVTARLNFLAQDRTDIQHATKKKSVGT